MGIRVHKVLGYGLSDIKVEKYSLVDPRFTLQGGAWDYFLELLAYDIKPEEYIYWLRHDLLKRNEEELASVGIHDTIMLRLLLGESKRRKKFKNSLKLEECLTHQSEFGFPNVMLFTPPDYLEEWVQCDSTMDWVSETYEHSQENRILALPGIYPYNSLQNKDGIVPNSIEAQVLYDQRQAAFEKGKLHEIKDTWPEIPPSVIAYILFLGIFREDVFSEVVTQLRPYFYVYWS